MIRTNRELLHDQTYDNLCDEARRLCDLVPGLSYENVEELLLDDAGEVAHCQVPFTLSIDVRSPCLRDDLVEALIGAAARLSGPSVGSYCVGDYRVEVKVRGR